MDANNHSEKDMLNDIFRGDKKAKEAFVKKYTKDIYKTIHHRLIKYKDDFLYHEEEEIYTSFFLYLFENNYKKLKSFRGKNNCSLKTWLQTVTLNFTRNEIKKEKKRHKSHIPIDTIEDFSHYNKIKKDSSLYPVSGKKTQERLECLRAKNRQVEPDVEFEKRENEKILKELKEDLNTEDRLFLKLYFEKRLSPKEIAKILNITESTVYSKKSRIIDKLRKIAKKNKILQEI